MDGRPETVPRGRDDPADGGAQDRGRALRELAEAIDEAVREVAARGCATPEEVAAMLRELDEEWAAADRAGATPSAGGRD